MISRETIIMPDVRDDTYLAQAFRAALGELGETTFSYVRACMVVPLSLKEQVIGMLVLTSSKEEAFTQHHSALALAIANQAAVAIENARLYEQAQALAAIEERQRLARELHDSVSQALYGSRWECIPPACNLIVIRKIWQSRWTMCSNWPKRR